MKADRAGSSWYPGTGFFFAPVLAVVAPWHAVTVVIWVLVALVGLLCLVSCGAARLLRRAAPRWSPLNRHPHSEVT